MIISEERFATAYLTPEGETRLFDDIGDMLLYMSKHKEAVAAPFVHDFETREWLPAQAGFYVRTDYVHSPMGWNIAAFADEAKARLCRANPGRIHDLERFIEDGFNFAPYQYTTVKLLGR